MRRFYYISPLFNLLLSYDRFYVVSQLYIDRWNFVLLLNKEVSAQVSHIDFSHGIQ